MISSEFSVVTMDDLQILKELTHISADEPNDTRVFMARWVAREIDVAVKVYGAGSTHHLPSLLYSAEAAKRAYLIGTNVDPFSTVRTLALLDDVFLISEYFEGATLSKIISDLRNLHLSLSKKIELIISITICVLQFQNSLDRLFNEKGLGHGDLHGHNILVKNRNNMYEVKLIDYDSIGKYLYSNRKNKNNIQDISKKCKSITQSPDYICGTIDYPDVSSDICSLGQIFFRILFSEPYFLNAEEFRSYIKSHLKKSTHWNSRIVQNELNSLTGELLYMINKMASPKRKDRPRSMQDVLNFFTNAYESVSHNE